MIKKVNRKIKNILIKIIWGKKFYNLFLKPFDKFIVEIKPSSLFHTEEIPLNKVCRISDCKNKLWSKGFEDLLFPSNEELFHRKIWEFCQIIYGLRKLKRLSPEAIALGIGCGHEELMYFFANKIKMVYAIDLYEQAYLGGEADDDVLIHPDKYAPFHYRADHLKIMRMNAKSLQFNDNTFDFVFSLSSIEHFGSRKSQLEALKEMRRVLKPAGILAITTELILNRIGRRKEYFMIEEIEELIQEAGFIVKEPFDLCIEKELADSPLALPMEVFKTPHVILRNLNTIHTSLSLFAEKPSASKDKLNAITGDEAYYPTRLYDYRASIEVLEAPNLINSNESFNIKLRIKNIGDATWYKNGSLSNMIRVGVFLCSENKENHKIELLHHNIPEDIYPGQIFDLTLNIPPIQKKGTFIFLIDLVKELKFWFREKGSQPALIKINSF